MVCYSYCLRYPLIEGSLTSFGLRKPYLRLASKASLVKYRPQMVTWQVFMVAFKYKTELQQDDSKFGDPYDYYRCGFMPPVENVWGSGLKFINAWPNLFFTSIFSLLLNPFGTLYSWYFYPYSRNYLFFKAFILFNWLDSPKILQ